MSSGRHRPMEWRRQMLEIDRGFCRSVVIRRLPILLQPDVMFVPLADKDNCVNRLSRCRRGASPFRGSRPRIQTAQMLKGSRWVAQMGWDELAARWYRRTSTGARAQSMSSSLTPKHQHVVPQSKAVPTVPRPIPANT